MKKIVKLPTLIGIIVLILGLGAGILLLNVQTIFKLKASPDTEPQDVRITNITDSSFTVSWTTDKETVGYVVYGENTTTNTNAPDPDPTAKNIHSIDIDGLTANTNYSFKINSDGNLKDNNGIAWKVKTGPVVTTGGTQVTISGTIVQTNGQPVSNATVFINSQGTSSISTTTSLNGSWVISVNKLRNTDLTSKAILSDQSLMEIFVQGGKLGIATAQIYLSSANPVPPIVIGQTHDFRNEKVNNSQTTPTSDITLPSETSPSSKFNVDTQTTPKDSTTVTLESIESGETVNTTVPEFFGEGPPNTEITITVHSSQEIKDTVKIASTGAWNWTPPESLEPGPHTITLSWKDAKGILRTLTRSFVVEAKEGAAFVSTPSATPKSSASPKPSSTPASTATATPKITMPATDSGTPVAGVATPTITLLVLATGFITTSIFVAKKSFEN